MSLGTDVEEDVGVTELYLGIPRDWMLCRSVTVDVVNEDAVIRYYSLALFLPLSVLPEKTRTTARVATKGLPSPPSQARSWSKKEERGREKERSRASKQAQPPREGCCVCQTILCDLLDSAVTAMGLHACAFLCTNRLSLLLRCQTTLGLLSQNKKSICTYV